MPAHRTDSESFAVPPTTGPEAVEVTRTPASSRVMSAGVELFSEVGFLATTIRDLTRACGLTAGAFYNHFESKEALLYAIITEANAKLERQIPGPPRDTDRPRDSLDQLVRTLVTFNLTYPKEARVANREYVFLQPGLRSDVVAHRRRVLAAFETVLASSDEPRGLLGADAPAPDLEIRLLAISVVNLTIAPTDWYSPEGALTIPQVAEAYCRLALRMTGLSH
jgi:AcrR family transcriptional regulator